MKKFLSVLLLCLSSLSFADYDRSEFGGGWSDFDHNCRDTRQEILARDSKKEVSWLLPEKCKIQSGWWVDPYTLRVFLYPQGLDIDHIIPLKYAYVHGAGEWPRSKKLQFANDPENLLAVAASANRQKGDKGPLNWLPSNEAYLCEYSSKWLYIAGKYQLEISALDNLKLKQIQEGCKIKKK
jgi:5-methylcytosine-specific restriction endonuclease McrA